MPYKTKPYTGSRLGLIVLLGLSLVLPAHADQTTSYTYNTLGLVETVDGPRVDIADVTTYGYDAQGNRISTTNALDQVTQTTAHDASGRPLNLVDPNGLTTQLGYDLRGRLISQAVSDGTTTQTTLYTYDPVGNLTDITQPDGTTLTLVYDPANRLIGLRDGLNNRIDYTLDAMGNHTREQISDINGTLLRSSQRVYDELGRLITLIDAQNQATGYQYDANGNLLQATDARFNPTGYLYDTLDRLQQNTDALNGVTDYTYDSQDNLTSVTDPNSLTTTYTYDAFDNLITQTSPDTGITSYTYDEAGNRRSQTDARGVTVTYSHDALNRLTSIQYPNPTLDVSYAYDQGVNGIGRLTSMSDANGITEFSYDKFGQLLSKSHTAGAITTVFQYAYDPFGRLASLTYPSGNQVLYSYDSLGQVNGLTLEQPDETQQPLAAAIQRLPFGPLRALDYGNGLSLSRSFDQDYRLIGQEITGILSSSYSHDPVGNLINWADLLDVGRDQLFNYDALDRLINASGAYGDLSYDYDATGNRLGFTQGFTTDTYDYALDSHRLLEILGSHPETRTYDAAGNTLQSGLGSYVYDDTDRPVQYTRAGVVTDYAYNGKGERVSKTVNGLTTHFRYGPNGQLLGEYDDTGSPIREYVFLEGQPLAQLSSGAGGNPVTYLQSVSAKQNWLNVDLGTHSVRPVVIASPPTTNGGQGIVVALDNITGSSAQVAVKEWNYLDGNHAFEDISLLALPPGRHPQADGSIWEVGRFNLEGTQLWQAIPFSQPYAAAPALFLTQQTANDMDITTVRARNVTASGFEAALFEQESLQNGHLSEEIGYLAIYQPTGNGVAEINGASFSYQLSQISLDRRWKTVGDQQLKVQEEKSLDSETTHALETLDMLQLAGHIFVQDVSSSDADTASVRRRGPTSAATVSVTPASSSLAYLHTDHLGAVVKATDETQQLVWDAERRPFGTRSLITAQIEMPLGFPGQYYDQESGAYYNYFRTYDPGTGRYLEADPIGVLFGGNAAPSGGKLNHLYSYVGSNPTRYSDPFGLEPWDWDGQGNTAICVYYDQRAAQNPNCNYYKEAADICRGRNPWVNSAMAAGLSAGWATGLQDSQSTVLNNIRDILTWEDRARRQEGTTDENQCVCGNDIDRYHDFAFDFSGIPPAFYGGNMWPQGLPPNPVPVDPRNSDDLRNWFR